MNTNYAVHFELDTIDSWIIMGIHWPPKVFYILTICQIAMTKLGLFNQDFKLTKVIKAWTFTAPF